MTTPRSTPAPHPEFPAGAARPDAIDHAADVPVGREPASPSKSRSALDRLIDRLEADEYPDEAVMASRRAFAAECRAELAATRTTAQAALTALEKNQHSSPDQDGEVYCRECSAWSRSDRKHEPVCSLAELIDRLRKIVRAG